MVLPGGSLDAPNTTGKVGVAEHIEHVEMPVFPKEAERSNTPEGASIHTMSESIEPPRKRRYRKRKTYACHSCRVRKRRCDNIMPCSNCVTRGIACEYRGQLVDHTSGHVEPLSNQDMRWVDSHGATTTTGSLVNSSPKTTSPAPNPRATISNGHLSTTRHVAGAMLDDATRQSTIDEQGAIHVEGGRDKYGIESCPRADNSLLRMPETTAEESEGSTPPSHGQLINTLSHADLRYRVPVLETEGGKEHSSTISCADEEVTTPRRSSTRSVAGRTGGGREPDTSELRVIIPGSRAQRAESHYLPTPVQGRRLFTHFLEHFDNVVYWYPLGPERDAFYSLFDRIYVPGNNLALHPSLLLLFVATFICTLSIAAPSLSLMHAVVHRAADIPPLIQRYMGLCLDVHKRFSQAGPPSYELEWVEAFVILGFAELDDSHTSMISRSALHMARLLGLDRLDSPESDEQRWAEQDARAVNSGLTNPGAIEAVRSALCRPLPGVVDVPVSPIGRWAGLTFLARDRTLRNRARKVWLQLVEDDWDRSRFNNGYTIQPTSYTTTHSQLPATPQAASPSLQGPKLWALYSSRLFLRNAAICREFFDKCADAQCHNEPVNYRLVLQWDAELHAMLEDRPRWIRWEVLDGPAPLDEQNALTPQMVIIQRFMASALVTTLVHRIFSLHLPFLICGARMPTFQYSYSTWRCVTYAKCFIRLWQKTSEFSSRSFNPHVSRLFHAGITLVTHLLTPLETIPALRKASDVGTRTSNHTGTISAAAGGVTIGRNDTPEGSGIHAHIEEHPYAQSLSEHESKAEELETFSLLDYVISQLKANDDRTSWHRGRMGRRLEALVTACSRLRAREDENASEIGDVNCDAEDDDAVARSNIGSTPLFTDALHGNVPDSISGATSAPKVRPLTAVTPTPGDNSDDGLIGLAALATHGAAAHGDASASVGAGSTYHSTSADSYLRGGTSVLSDAAVEAISTHSSQDMTAPNTVGWPVTAEAAPEAAVGSDLPCDTYPRLAPGYGMQTDHFVPGTVRGAPGGSSADILDFLQSSFAFTEPQELDCLWEGLLHSLSTQ